MEDWEQRVVDERAALSTKIVALAAFITSNTTFQSLPFDAKNLMRKQLTVMLDYDNMLEQRIEIFSAKYFSKAM
jgi:hypothetical protein